MCVRYMDARKHDVMLSTLVPCVVCWYKFVPRSKSAVAVNLAVFEDGGIPYVHSGCCNNCLTQDLFCLIQFPRSTAKLHHGHILV